MRGSCTTRFQQLNQFNIDHDSLYDTAYQNSEQVRNQRVCVDTDTIVHYPNRIPIYGVFEAGVQQNSADFEVNANSSFVGLGLVLIHVHK